MATLKSLLDLIDRFTPELRRAFLASVQDIKDTARIGQIIAAIERGDINGAIQSLGIEPAAMRPLTAATEAAFETGGIFTASQFQRPVSSAAFRFDVRNSRAEAAIRGITSWDTTFTDDQFNMIRGFLNDGMVKGVNPRTMALDLIGRIDPVTGRRTGGIIGLNGPQERYLANARNELATLHSDAEALARYKARTLRDARFDSVVDKAARTGTPLTSEQLDRLGTRYSDNLLQWRGETIARDQSIKALNTAQNEATQQLIDTGAVDTQDVKREWDASGDNRTRPSHAAMDGQQVGPNEAFKVTSGPNTGAVMMFPGDSSLGAPLEETIQCRCRVRLRVDYIAAANRRSNALPTF